MSFFCRLSRRHYWWTPHRSADNRLVQVCYECGAERPARELHTELSFDRKSGPGAVPRPEITRRAVPRIVPAQAAVAEPVAAGQVRLRRLLVVKCKAWWEGLG